MKMRDVRNAAMFPLIYRRVQIISEVYQEIMEYLDKTVLGRQDPPVDKEDTMKYLSKLDNEVSVGIKVTDDEDYDRKLVDSVISRLKEDGFKIDVDFYENEYILFVSWPSLVDDKINKKHLT